jgi:hypothetical protein
MPYNKTRNSILSCLEFPVFLFHNHVTQKMLYAATWGAAFGRVGSAAVPSIAVGSVSVPTGNRQARWPALRNFGRVGSATVPTGETEKLKDVPKFTEHPILGKSVKR